MKIINTSGKKKMATARATLKEGKGVARSNNSPSTASPASDENTEYNTTEEVLKSKQKV